MKANTFQYKMKPNLVVLNFIIALSANKQAKNNIQTRKAKKQAKKATKRNIV